MALSDIRPLKSKIPVNAESGDPQFFEVRALTLNDIEFLMSTYSEQVNDLVEVYKRSASSDDSRLAEFMTGAMREFPELLCQVIACASDEASPEGIAAARSLPATCQLYSLTEIFRLTFTVNGGVGKFKDQISLIWSSIKARSKN